MSRLSHACCSRSEKPQITNSALKPLVNTKRLFEIHRLKLTSDADVKIVVKFAADVFDQVSGVVEALLVLLPVTAHGVCPGLETNI